MAKIGNWGRYLKFQTSDDRILTFNGMQHTAKLRYATHEMAYGKPKVEYLGTQLETVKFTMQLVALYCRRPREVETKLDRLISEGVYAPLVVGGRTVMRRAMLQSVSGTYDIVMKKGRIYSIKVDVSMMEYN